MDTLRNLPGALVDLMSGLAVASDHLESGRQRGKKVCAQDPAA